MKLVPLEIITEFESNLSKLKAIILVEASSVFKEVISNFKNDGLYSLGLYHCGEYHRYLTLSFSTEKGLDQVTEQYMRHALITYEQQRVYLRWSPCDSPYHDTDYELADIEQALDAVKLTLEKIYQALCDAGTEEIYELLHSAHQQVRHTIVSAMAEIAKHKTIAKWLEETNGVLVLNAGDIDHNDVLNDIDKINGKEKRQMVEAEFEMDYEVLKLNYLLMEKKRAEDEKCPPTTSLKVDDFDEQIESFSPVIIHEDDCVYLKESSKPVLQEHESASNRLVIMELLKSSAHYDELDELSGHFTGPQFKEGDLLPALGERFVEKLKTILSTSFPKISFVIELHVDRTSLCHICFYQGDNTSLSEYYQSMKDFEESLPSGSMGVLKSYVVSAID